MDFGQRLGSAGFPGLYHLVLFGGLLPWAAIRGRRKFRERVLPNKTRYFLVVIAQQLAFVFLSLMVAHALRLELLPAPTITLAQVLAGALVLAAAVFVIWPRRRGKTWTANRATYLLTPHTPLERVLWIGVSVAAGIGEEITYRGVLYGVLAILTGSPVVSALLAALMFATAHAGQGWRGVALTGVFATAFHALVWISGALYLAMFVHVWYDVTVGLAYSYLGEKYGYPVKSLPAAPSPAPEQVA